MRKAQCWRQPHLYLDLQLHCYLSLHLEGISDRFHRRFKEFGDVVSVQPFGASIQWKARALTQPA